MRPLSRRPQLRLFTFALILATGSVAAATVSRQLMGPLLAEEMAYMPFLAAVVVAALYGGWAAGAASALLGSVFANYVFLGGYGRLDTEPQSLWGGAFFLVFGLGLTALVERMKAALDRQAELNAKLELVNGELQHRIRNVIGVVQGLARQGASQAPSAGALYEQLSERLEALARAQLLLGGGDTPVHLSELLSTILAPFDLQRFDLSLSSPDLRVPSAATVPLSLALHELATNAVKYGSLSTPGGAVRLAAAATRGGIAISWREQGGPRVQAPVRAGFGSKLLRSAFPAGQVSIAFLPQGLSCEILLPAA